MTITIDRTAMTATGGCPPISALVSVLLRVVPLGGVVGGMVGDVDGGEDGSGVGDM